MTEHKRENWIDFVKLLAMLIVVMNHAGLTVGYFSFIGGMFFVPVFFVLSGYTYHEKNETLKRFTIKKAKRLLVPYFVCNAFLFAFFFCKDVLVSHSKAAGEMMTSLLGIFYARNQLINMGHPSFYTPTTIKQVYLMPILNSPTWFLPALFLTIFMFECAMIISHRDLKKLWLIGVILYLVGVLYHNYTPLLLMWSLDSMPFFYVMMLMGYTLKKTNAMEWFDHRLWVLGIVLVVFMASAYLNGSTNFSIAYYGISITLAVYNALASSICIMYICKKGNRLIPGFLAMAGRQTLLILCYHMFLLSVFDMILSFVPLILRIIIVICLLSVWGIIWEHFRRLKKQEDDYANRAEK